MNPRPQTPDPRRFSFKTFQREDYARAALHDGVILGHDTGGGKTIALYVLAALKCGFRRDVKRLEPLKPVLLVAPGDLHDQIIQEGVDHFRANVTHIGSQAEFLELSSVNPAGGAPIVPPGYYITSYTQLTGNGVVDFPKFDPANWRGMMQKLGLNEEAAIKYFNLRGELYKRQYERLSAQPEFSAGQLLVTHRLARLEAKSDKTRREVDADYATLQNMATPHTGGEFNDLEDHQQAWIMQQMTAFYYTQYHTSIGTSKWLKHTPASTLPDGFKRTEGRAGEPQEFVELETPAGHRYIAQLAKGADKPNEWITYNGEGDGFPYVDKVFQSRGEAVDHIETLAKLPRPEAQSFKVKCVYSPSLADLAQDSFACVSVDEGVKMKGEDTEVGLGVRQMNSPYKYVLSATPIKNRLPDAFRLAWWATGAHGEAHARFPYPDSSAAREEFSAEFLISERNLSKERAGKSSRFKKLTPQVCNIHRLWKLFAPVILRRRKADFGEDIVSKTRHVVRVPMGRSQALVYKFHLDALYTDINGRPAIGAQLQALRIAAANPCSELLRRPVGDGKTEGPPRSALSHIPKLHAAFNLITQILGRGEQVVIFSAFQDALDMLQSRLQEAGVRHCVLDGRTGPPKRAAIAAQFKWGPPKAGNRMASPFPVMLAGIECMAEGHSFNLCNNVILMSYSWAYDKFEQGINRVHRLNSRWPVNVYPILCDGSIDRKLEAMIAEKGEAAELVLDGKLLGEQQEEVNLAELLLTARAEFEGKEVVDEADMETEWPRIRTGLMQAMQSWNKPWLQVPIMAETVTTTSAVVEVETVTVTQTPDPRPQTPTVSTPRPSVPRSVPKAAPVGFEDMALWKQSPALPKRPLPWMKAR